MTKFVLMSFAWPFAIYGLVLTLFKDIPIY